MSADANADLTGAMVGENYKLGKLIGKGSFGEIRYVRNVSSNRLLAAKLEVISNKPQLEREYKFYQMIQSTIDRSGIPQVYYYGLKGRFHVMVMDLFGPNLDDVFTDICRKQFSLKTIIYIFIQLLQRIEHIHNCHLVYRDIKTDNFVLGLEGTPERNIIHIIDFGSAKLYIDPNTKKHIPLAKNKPLKGTTRYMSINAHLGKEQSRRDDLEAIGYMMMYFLRQGRLPWSGLKAKDLKERYRKIGQFKRGTPIETLCYGYPEEFANYFRTVRLLQFDEQPNYHSLKALFINLFGKERLPDDDLYDWN